MLNYDWNYRITDKKTNPPEVCPQDALAFARERLGFEPDQHQSAILAGRRHRLLMNCSRQWGKSTVTAAKAVWQAYTHPGSLTVVICPVEKQSAEFIRKAAVFLRRLHLPVRGDGSNKVSLALPNGARIVGLSDVPASARGFSSVSLLIVDEAAQVNPAAYWTIRPMLAVCDGDLWLLSTPFGNRGFFYDEWMGRSEQPEEWFRVSVPATECPRIPAAFLERERKTMDDAFFRQEFMCEFIAGQGCFFDRNMVEAAFRDDVSALQWS